MGHAAAGSAALGCKIMSRLHGMHAMALYDAFISYSHAKDKAIAAALQTVIQKLGKPWYRRRALRVFRDDTSLSATPQLWPSIEQALGHSRYFILLASPEAAASKWVNKEVAYWLDHNSIDTLLIGVTAGELLWDEATGGFSAREKIPLPPVLSGRFVTEPKWVDLAAYRDGADKGDAKFTELAADFAAAIHGTPKEDLLSQEVRQQRRALSLAYSGVATLAVLMLIAGWQWKAAVDNERRAIANERIATEQKQFAQVQRDRALAAEQTATEQKDIAQQQRDRAEKTLAAATKTANDMVFNLAQRFRDATGIPIALVKDILDRARALQEQLINSGQVTASLKRSEAEALMETVNALLAIGDITGALAAASQAQQVFANLAAANPGSTDDLRELSVAYNRVGDVKKAQGDLVGALTAYQASLAMRQRLAQSDPSRAVWQRDVSVSYSRIGDVEKAQGDLAGALKSYRDSIATVERLAQPDPGNAEWQRDLAISYNRLGDVLALQGKLAEALKAYRDDLAIAERLAAADPSNTQWQRDLLISYRLIGDVLVAQGKLDEALKAYRDSLAIAEGLAAADRDNTEWQRELSGDYDKIGGVLKAQGNLDEALEAYRDSLAIVDRLIAADRTNTQWQRGLSVCYNRVGNVLLAQGKLEEALKAYRDGLAIAERLVAANPRIGLWQEDLQYGIGRIGTLADNFIRAGNFSKALEAADEAIALAPDKIWLYSNRAHALMFLGRLDEARVLYLKYRGQQNVFGNQSWEAGILEDFAEFQKAGLTHPLMQELEKAFAGS